MPSLVLTPRGHLLFTRAGDDIELASALARVLEPAFARGSGYGLLELGAGEVGTALPADLSYWRDFAGRLVTTICTHPDLDAHEAPIPAPALRDLEALAAAAPPMDGAEYVTASVLETLWTADRRGIPIRTRRIERRRSRSFCSARTPRGISSAASTSTSPRTGRDDEAPFAFLATYTTQLSAHAKAQHLPLGRALSEYAGAANKPRLLSLLLPVQRAAAECPWLKTMVDAGEIYHPLRWTPAEAFQLLTDVPRLEAAGVIVRVPAAWRARSSAAPAGHRHRRRQAAFGPRHGGAARFPDGRHPRRRTADRDGDCRQLLAASNGLHLVRGRWVEVDRRPLGRMLEPVPSGGSAPQRRAACPSAKRCASSPARTCRATSSPTALPTGRRSSPDRGWQRRWPAFAIRTTWRNWIPAPR